VAVVAEALAAAEVVAEVVAEEKEVHSQCRATLLR
jgi:hypothetical protein